MLTATEIRKAVETLKKASIKPCKECHMTVRVVHGVMVASCNKCGLSMSVTPEQVRQFEEIIRG